MASLATSSHILQINLQAKSDRSQTKLIGSSDRPVLFALVVQMAEFASFILYLS
ncbi:hypothetical protein JYQ62_05760 [Nostoc sp. UHCC 0702]|nr:hypothetical protein JYQ62_05760 [Nostoc sp. UHCC 0702]